MRSCATHAKGEHHILNPLLETFKDLWGYVKATRNIVVALLITFLLLLGTVIVLTEGTAVMPFIYTIF
jgi:hypothetical protein